MFKYSARRLNIVGWTLSMIVVVVAVLAWGQSYNWHFSSNYQLFPLFGLLAFSLMWVHYVVAVKRMRSGLDKKVTKNYFENTSLAVVALILLHPGLLAWQLWRDGHGLPPASELRYVAPALQGAVILGMVSLIVFLAYELNRQFGDKPWWKFVSLASDVAMLFIFIHALRLGDQLQKGWFKTVWLFYGVVLVICLLYIHAPRSGKQLKKT